MLFIPNLTNDPYQQIGVKNEDGIEFQMTFWYLEQQISWFYTLNYISLEGKSFVLGQRRLTIGNLLINYRNQLPFGLFCISQDNGDPSNLNDFVPINSRDIFSSRIQIYSLSQEEVKEVNTIITPI